MAIKSVSFLRTFDFAGNKRKTIAKVACISVRESREVDPTKYTTIHYTACREIYLVNMVDRLLKHKRSHTFMVSPEANDLLIFFHVLTYFTKT